MGRRVFRGISVKVFLQMFKQNLNEITIGIFKEIENLFGHISNFQINGRKNLEELPNEFTKGFLEETAEEIPKRIAEEAV